MGAVAGCQNMKVHIGTLLLAVACSLTGSLAAGQAELPLPSLSGQPGEAVEQERDIAAAKLEALTLREAMNVAFARNRDVQAARAALDAARGVYISAGKRPNPTLTLGGGPGLIGQYNARDADLLVGYSQPIERGNKRELRSDAAGAAQDAARLDIDNGFRQLRLAVAATYYALKQEQERFELAQANRDAFAMTLEAAELRLKAGDVARSDLVRLRVEAGRGENEVQQARADLGIARAAIAAVLAREADARSIRVVDPWPIAGAATPWRDRMNDLIEIRSDVRASAARVRSAESSYELAKALRTRDFNLAVTTERNLPANGGTTLQFQVAIPLFVNNDYGGEIVRAEADLKTARINLEKVRGTARFEAERALELFDSARAQLARFESQIGPDAQWAVDAAEFAYKKGGDSSDRFARCAPPVLRDSAPGA